MADWSKPTNSSLKSNVLGETRATVANAACMDYTGDTNLPTVDSATKGVIRYNRSTKVFQEWLSSAWNDREITNLADGAVSTSAKITNGTVTENKLGAGVGTPVGSLLPYAGAAAPTGYLLCNGTAVSRTTYASLFAVTGTTYGVGDGSTTFNIPDMRGFFPLGKSVSGTGSTLGGIGGNIDHTHTGPSHTHPLSSAGQAQIAYEFILATDNLSFNKVTTASYTSNRQARVTSIASGSSTLTDGIGLAGTTDAAGTGATSAANPPFLSLNYIIKY